MNTSPLLRKTLAALLIVFGVTAAAAAASSGWRTYTNLTEQYTSKGTAVADGIASSSVELLLFRDVSTVQAMIDQYLEIEGVAYVFVVDPHGDTLAHTFVPTVPTQVMSLEGRERETTVQDVSIPGYGECLNVTSPILAGKIGYVHVGMDRGLIRKAISDAVVRQLVLLLPIFFLSLLAAYALMNKIVQPLNRLTVSANKLAAGGATAEEKEKQDAELRHISARSDEVGQLAGAFREMVLKVSIREKELREAHDHLESRVLQRTSELEQANVRLQQEIDVRKRTEQELGRSNRELEQFAYIASHDLQEPLRKVQAFGDILVHSYRDALGEEGRDYLQRMESACKRMRVLIEDLLTYSRVTRTAKPFVEVDLAKVVHEVVADLETRIRQSGGQVVVGDLPRIDGEPVQMHQLLQNLIGNALKFHAANVNPLVTVLGRVFWDAANVQQVEIIVRDNGIGFDEKYLDRIFAPFQRLHGRGDYEGTGIGLAICRKIAERHSGTITARSTPGQGTTFIVILPLRQPKGKQHHD